MTCAGASMLVRARLPRVEVPPGHSPQLPQPGPTTSPAHCSKPAGCDWLSRSRKRWTTGVTGITNSSATASSWPSSPNAPTRTAPSGLPAASAPLKLGRRDEKKSPTSADRLNPGIHNTGFRRPLRWPVNPSRPAHTRFVRPSQSCQTLYVVGPPIGDETPLTSENSQTW